MSLATTYLTSTIDGSATTLNLKNVYFDSSQKNGFPDEGEVLIPFYNSTESVWSVERILYGAKDVNVNTLTVATGGRGHEGTGPTGTSGVGHPHTVVTGTYTSTRNCSFHNHKRCTFLIHWSKNLS